MEVGTQIQHGKPWGGVGRSPWGRGAPASREATGMVLQAHLWGESGWVLAAAAALLGRGHQPRGCSCVSGSGFVGL